MDNDQWPQDMPDNWTTKEIQLRLFPMTEYEVLALSLKENVKELKEKLERQRKGQFGKIGRLEKRLTDLEERYGHLERGICQSTPENTCQILEMVGR